VVILNEPFPSYIGERCLERISRGSAQNEREAAKIKVGFLYFRQTRERFMRERK
jgi:hypothetical protein